MLFRQRSASYRLAWTSFVLFVRGGVESSLRPCYALALVWFKGRRSFCLGVLSAWYCSNSPNGIEPARLGTGNHFGGRLAALGKGQPWSVDGGALAGV